MNELRVFQNSEFGELGILLIDGKEYFPATQCAKTLGYKNARDAILRLKGNSNIRKQLLGASLPYKSFQNAFVRFYINHNENPPVPSIFPLCNYECEMQFLC